MLLYYWTRSNSTGREAAVTIAVVPVVRVERTDLLLRRDVSDVSSLAAGMSPADQGCDAGASEAFCSGKPEGPAARRLQFALP